MTLKDFRFPSSTLRGLEKQAIIISTNGYTWDTPVTFSRMEALCTEPLPKDQTSAKRGFNSSIQYVTDFLQPVGSAIILSLDHSLSSRSKVSGLGAFKIILIKHFYSSIYQSFSSIGSDRKIGTWTELKVQINA
jgi:hypothetical protein